MVRKQRTAEEKARRKAAEEQPEAKAKIRATQQRWNAANPGNSTRRAQAFRSTLEGRANTLAYSAQTRSKQWQTFCDVTTEFLLPLLEEAIAAGIVTCDSKKPDTASIDRIDASKGYVQGNVQIVPWWYNAAKHDFKAEDLHVAMLNWRLVHG